MKKIFLVKLECWDKVMGCWNIINKVELLPEDNELLKFWGNERIKYINKRFTSWKLKNPIIKKDIELLKKLEEIL